MNNINIRINDIEFRNHAVFTRGEFIHWSPNPDYGKLDEYIKNGWTDEGDRIVQTELYRCSRSKSLFDLKETCYVVAWLKYDEKDEVCDLETVGDRMLRLENIHDFMDVYKIADKKMMEMNKRDE